MYINIVYLSIRQLMRLGIHLGHDKKNTKFLSSWIFGGWRHNVFIISLIKTFFLFKIGLRTFIRAGLRRRPVWFVTLSRFFGPLVARYGYISGEVFNIYWWINGSITNFFTIIGWHQLLIRLMMKNKYRLRHIDKKKLIGFFGIIHHRKRIPFAAFVPNVLDSLNAVDEFLTGKIPCLGIIDSNVGSWNVSIPVPGNDDSMVCINYYCYMVSRSIISGKITFIRRWNFGIYRVNVKYRSFFKFVYLYLNVYRNFNQNKFFNILNTIEFNKLNLDLNIKDAILENVFLTNIYSNYTKNAFFFNNKTFTDSNLYYI